VKGVGLALGGGVVYSVASVGVAKALESAGIPFVAVAGTSGGALVGAAIAAGIPAGRLAEMTGEIGWGDLISFMPNRMGLMDGSPTARFVEKLCGVSRIEELKVPFSAVACDISAGTEVRFTSGPLGPAVQASCSIPGLFQPPLIGGRLLVDGGIVANVPVRALEELGPAVTLAVDVLALAPSQQGRLRTGAHVILKAYNTMVREMSVGEERKADMVVVPDVSGWSVMNFRDAPGLVKAGEEAMQPLLPRLRSLLEGRK